MENSMQKPKPPLSMIDLERTISLLKHTVRTLAHRKSEELDLSLLKVLKKMCQESDFHILTLSEYLLKLMKGKDVRARLNCFKMCDEIFRRSHCFRFLFLSNYKQFSRHMFRPLNEEKKQSRTLILKLQSKSVDIITNWLTRYEKYYPSLNDFKKYLTTTLSVDFTEKRVLLPSEERKLMEKRVLDEASHEEAVIRVQHDFECLEPEITASIQSMKSSLDLITLNLDEVNEEESKGINELMDKTKTRGMDSDESSESDLSVIQITFDDIRRISVDDNNKAVLIYLGELVTTATKTYLPRVSHIHKVISVHKTQEQELFNKVDTLLDKVKLAIDKYGQIKLVTASGVSILSDTLPRAIENFKEPIKEQVEKDEGHDFEQVEEPSVDFNKVESDILTYMLRNGI